MRCENLLPTGGGLEIGFCFVGGGGGALLVGGGLLVLILFAQLKSPWDRSAEYLGAARFARATGNLEAASIYYEKALVERSDDEVALFEWVTVSDEIGERATRDATLRYLVEEVVYPPALLFDAQLKLREGSVDEVVARLLASLEIIPAEDRGKGSPLSLALDELRRGVMRFHWKRGEFREAIEQRMQLESPTVRDELDLAVLHLGAGDREVAAAKAAVLVEGLKREVGNLQMGFVLAAAEAIRGNEEAVFAQLVGAQVGEGGRQAAMEIRIRCFELLRQSMVEIPDLRLIEPLAAAGMPMMAGLLVGLCDDENLKKEALMRALAGGAVPVVGHFLAGLRAVSAGLKEEASLHFSMAGDLVGASGRLLGWCGLRLAQLGGRDEEALMVAQVASTVLSPSQGALIQWRIFLALERWDDAEALLDGGGLPSDEEGSFRNELEKIRED